MVLEITILVSLVNSVVLFIVIGGILWESFNRLLIVSVEGLPFDW
jgi:Co/Zn/Cd efflux system component